MEIRKNPPENQKPPTKTAKLIGGLKKISDLCPIHFTFKKVSDASKESDNRAIAAIVSKTEKVKGKIPKKTLAAVTLLFTLYIHYDYCLRLIKGFVNYDSKGHTKVVRLEKVPEQSKRLKIEVNDKKHNEAVKYIMENYPDVKQIYQLKKQEAGPKVRISFFYRASDGKLSIQMCKQNICKCSNKLIDTTTVFDIKDLEVNEILQIPKSR